MGFAGWRPLGRMWRGGAGTWPARSVAAGDGAGRRGDVDFAVLCDGRVVAVPRSRLARTRALRAQQAAAERRLHVRLRLAVLERDEGWRRRPWRAA